METVYALQGITLQIAVDLLYLPARNLMINHTFPAHCIIPDFMMMMIITNLLDVA